MGSHLLDQLNGLFIIVRPEIVHDNHVSFVKAWNQDSVNVCPEGERVRCSIELHGSGLARDSDGRYQRSCAPMAMRGVGKKPEAMSRTPSKPGHVGLNSGFVKKDQLVWIKGRKQRHPKLPLELHIFTLLFAGVQRFF